MVSQEETSKIEGPPSIQPLNLFQRFFLDLSFQF